MRVTLPIDVPIYQDVDLGLPGNLLCLPVVFREGLISHVSEQVHGPGRGCSLGRYGITGVGGSLLPGLANVSHREVESPGSGGVAGDVAEAGAAPGAPCAEEEGSPGAGLGST